MNIRIEHTLAQPIRFHEYAEAFPWLEGAALDALREDIRQHGVREPIVMLDGAILDGRNRYVCARDLGIEYPVVEYAGDDPLAYVVSLNLLRRHLNESQRASAAAKLANLPRGANQHTAIAASSPTQAEAAKMLNVSVDSLQRAKKVQDTAPPEILRAVDQGHLSVSLAARVADLPEEAKADVVAMVSAKREPTRAELQRSVLAAVADARKPADRRNPDRVANPHRDAVLSFIDHCEQLALTKNLDAIAAYADPMFPTTAQRLDRVAAQALETLTKFMEARHA